jgi:hypothetical protein
MVRIIVQPGILAQLHQLDCELELCDSAGQTLGYFVPAASRLEAEYVAAIAQVSDEELAQARAEPGGRSLQEIMRDLRQQ